MKNTIINIGLINPKSPSNVGSVLRASGCFQADKIFYTGVRFERAAQFNTDTQSVEGYVSLKGVDDLYSTVEYGTEVVCVDLVEGATSLPDFKHPEKALYVFGPEDGTISQDIVNKADHVVYIPTIGCLNLAASVNVVLYDRVAKLKPFTANDDLIRESRDINNHRKVNK
ncbi:MAG: RNA methyltransferase [Methylococcales bacterium]|mgnify:CR=1 FL=1|jgi:tRNA(Leu) C34 or U34 (ribose-2'-O)-methylase TrmL|nr:RNA methyltransferase [Methylococcales bacterium]MBT7444581.1 RNA methyltransferase [Methylococcales bacterium]